MGWTIRGSNPVGGRDFPHPSTRRGFHPATTSFPRLKRPERGVYHPPPSSAEAEGRVELYICSVFGPSWPVLGWTLPDVCVLWLSYSVFRQKRVPFRTYHLRATGLKHKLKLCLPNSLLVKCTGVHLRDGMMLRLWSSGSWRRVFWHMGTGFSTQYTLPSFMVEPSYQMTRCHTSKDCDINPCWARFIRFLLSWNCEIQFKNTKQNVSVSILTFHTF